MVTFFPIKILTERREKMADINNEKQHQRNLDVVKNLRLLDDDLMAAVFDNDKELTELVLNIIIGIPNLKVQKVVGQKTIKNLKGHSAILDIFAIDDKGIQYDIEIQRADKGASEKRARYHSSLIDANSLSKGENFDKLPETYVIFITEKDYFNKGLPIYHIDRIIRETNETFKDKSHIIYVNGAHKNIDTDLGKLMHDFRMKEPAKMHYQQLAEKTSYFKENEKGVKKMCRAVEEYGNKRCEEGRTEGTKETLLDLYKEGSITLEKLMEKLNISKSEAEKLVVN